MDEYGLDHEALAAYMQTLPNGPINIESLEVSLPENDEDRFSISRKTFTDVAKLESHLLNKVRISSRLPYVCASLPNH